MLLGHTSRPQRAWLWYDMMMHTYIRSTYHHHGGHEPLRTIMARTKNKPWALQQYIQKLKITSSFVLSTTYSSTATYSRWQKKQVKTQPVCEREVSRNFLCFEQRPRPPIAPNRNGTPRQTLLLFYPVLLTVHHEQTRHDTTRHNRSSSAQTHPSMPKKINRKQETRTTSAEKTNRRAINYSILLYTSIIDPHNK